MNRVVDQMAAERGMDLSRGIPPDIRSVLTHQAERAYEEWIARIQDGELATPSTPIEFLLAEIYAIDGQLDDTRTGGRGPNDTLQ
jgi:hypothetical protein